jgi:hypothetical protein
MRAWTLLGSLSLGLGLAACDRGGKEGEACYSGTQESSDCAQGLSCVQCGKTPTCEHVEGFDDEYARVAGKLCTQIKDLREQREIQRGQAQ